MDCAEEVGALKRELSTLVGREDRLAFDILNGKLTIRGSGAEVTAAQVIEAVARTGMRAELWQDHVDQQRDGGFWQQRGRTVMTAASGFFGLVGLVTHALLAGGYAAAMGSEGMGIVETAPLPANQFPTEAEAKARCPSDTVVWVNLRSRIYHFSGNKSYGTTEHGAYMCEKDTAAEGMRAAKNETHP